MLRINPERHITASTRLRFAPPKLAPVGHQLRVLAERYATAAPFKRV
jgi:hypothetical protein